jgi:uncharacterized cupin superfamily protein
MTNPVFDSRSATSFATGPEDGSDRFGANLMPFGLVCGAPKGGPDTAHQLVITGDKSLKYITILNPHDPDVVEYPESGKYVAIAIAPGESFMQAHLLVVGRVHDSLDYWEGENA